MNIDSPNDVDLIGPDLNAIFFRGEQFDSTPPESLFTRSLNSSDGSLPPPENDFTLDRFDDSFIDSLRSAKSATSSDNRDDDSSNSMGLYDNPTSSVAFTGWGSGETNTSTTGNMFDDSIDRLPHLFGEAAVPPAPPKTNLWSNNSSHMNTDMPLSSPFVSASEPTQQPLTSTSYDSTLPTSLIHYNRDTKTLSARIAASLSASTTSSKDRRRTRARKKISRSSSLNNALLANTAATSTGVRKRPQLMSHNSAPNLLRHAAKKQRSRPSSLKFDATHETIMSQAAPIHLRKPRKRGKRSAGSGSGSTSSEDVPPSSGSTDFVVARQPKPKQRKSYKNENRYLSPNPLVVQWTGPGPAPAARVTAYLADLSGTTLPSDRQAELVGERHSLLDDDGAAQFSLKMHDTSRGKWLRLRFEIEWFESSQVVWLCTSKFRVDTNIRKA